MAIINKAVVVHFRSDVSIIYQALEGIMNNNSLNDPRYPIAIKQFLENAPYFLSHTKDSLNHLFKNENSLVKTIQLMEEAGIHAKVLEEFKGYDKQILVVLKDIESSLNVIMDYEAQHSILNNLLQAIQRGVIDSNEALKTAGRFVPVFIDRFKQLYNQLNSFKQLSEQLGEQYKNAESVINDATKRLEEELEHEKFFIKNIKTWSD